jgi:predicted component of type VI protein secretion system
MTDVLVGKEGPLAGQRLELNEELVLGREGDEKIDDDQMSRRHAVVRPVEDGVEVEDLGSLNGTFVNGRRIEAVTRLAGGDVIKVGQTVLELEVARVPAAVGAEADSSARPTTATPTPAAEAPPAPAPAPAAPAPPPAPAAPSAAPAQPFGAYAVPESKRRRGIASRQLGPMVISWAAVIATAVALAIYFADHPT